MADLSPRQALVLAALASAKGGDFAPVQVQKLFFLIDRKIPDEVGGAQFHFSPYDYGPFDSAVYSELEALSKIGLVFIEPVPWATKRRFYLSPAGQQRGQNHLNGLSPRARNFLERTTAWIRSLPFAELVGAIYKEFPDMKANSVFKDPDQGSTS